MSRIALFGLFLFFSLVCVLFDVAFWLRYAPADLWRWLKREWQQAGEAAGSPRAGDRK